MIFEDGEQTRDFIHVSDIVQANLLALEKDSADYQALNIGTGRATSVREVARLLTEGLKKDLQPEVVGKYREGDIRHCFADISRARKYLGYEPKIWRWDSQLLVGARQTPPIASRTTWNGIAAAGALIRTSSPQKRCITTAEFALSVLPGELTDCSGKPVKRRTA